MAICDLIEMNGLLGPDARLMGLDLGAKTMGVAVSDVTRTIATARTTLRRTKLTRDIEALRAMIAAEGIGGIVVGLPVNMDGSEGPRAQSTRDIAARLAEALALPVAFWDERLSTVAAERPLLDADLSRRKRARSSIGWPRPTSCRERSTGFAGPERFRFARKRSGPLFAHGGRPAAGASARAPQGRRAAVAACRVSDKDGPAPIADQGRNSRIAPSCTTRLASSTMARPGTVISGGAALPKARSSSSTIAGSA